MTLVQRHQHRLKCIQGTDCCPPDILCICAVLWSFPLFCSFLDYFWIFTPQWHLRIHLRRQWSLSQRTRMARRGKVLIFLKLKIDLCTSQTWWAQSCSDRLYANLTFWCLQNNHIYCNYLLKLNIQYTLSVSIFIVADFRTYAILSFHPFFGFKLLSTIFHYPNGSQSLALWIKKFLLYFSCN